MSKWNNNVWDFKWIINSGKAQLMFKAADLGGISS